jgi:DNA-binding response OmpR family regulator
MPARILVIDDDPSIVRLIKNVLLLEKYDVVTREKIDEINLCDFAGFDLILLDIMMPISGLDICEAIRDKISTPILFLTARDLEEDLLTGIRAGADDYITKPFRVQELLARVRMHLRREARHTGTAKTITSGDFTIDFEARSARLRGETLPLTQREFLILELLVTHPNKIFTIEDLYDRLYPISSSTNLRSVSEYIYQIRSKCKPYGLNPIETVWGGGYKWRKEYPSAT